MFYRKKYQAVLQTKENLRGVCNQKGKIKFGNLKEVIELSMGTSGRRLFHSQYWLEPKSQTAEQLA